MTVFKHHGEMLTEKRSENGFRVVRRGRRFGRFYRQRSWHWVFFLAALFLMCSVPFALKFFSHGKLESRALNTQEVQEVTSDIVKPRSNRTRRYFACIIGFSESVTEIVELNDFMNFSKFSLDYIEKEDKPFYNQLF
ncbi:hypothetical protein Patl1_15885 [Pistacia atlantica]|uniref:Uncharacterized protein n=1 Tax=Pistacia atlantica TaxID=434234 RepID=A0ACC1B5T5_9ROSI|nr:hypothetical protein Patl1_15885 [Pistacia atlantica]